MKKKTLLFTLVAGMCYLGFSSYQSGPASSGQNCSGAKGSTTNCGGGGCHGGASTATTPTIRVDSTGGVAVNKYVAGMTYTVTVTGAHTSLTHFGFQYAVVSGSGASQVQAGTFGTSLPSQVAKHSLSGLNFIEQTSAIAGSGSPATSFSKVFTWTAPTTTTGDITMYLTVNAVNGNGSEDGTDVSGNISKVLARESSLAVATVTNAISVTTYPNPVTNTLNLQLNNTQAGAYAVTVYDLSGKMVANENINMNSTAQVSTINTASWNAGMYVVSIEKDGARQTTTVVKQ